MTLRQYAAIKLCVPDSGLEWLDDMIRQAQRDRFAGQAIAGAIDDYDRITRIGRDNTRCLPYSNSVLGSRETIIATQAYNYADAVIAERKGGAA
jgi:hypothetical protein